MSWDAIDDALNVSETSLFLKWEDGGAYQLVYLGPGEPFFYYDERYTDTSGKPKQKLMGCFAVLDGGKWRVGMVDQPIQTPAKFWQNFRKAAEKANDWPQPKSLYMVSRDGTQKSTRYSAAFIRALTDEDVAAIDELEPVNPKAFRENKGEDIQF